MSNFFTAIKLALRFWPSIAAAAVCSFLVAALWGANIGAFLPILEVTIRGRSAQEWVDSEIDTRNENIASMQEQIANIEQAETPDKKAVEVLNGKLSIEKAQRASYAGIKPWVDNYVPNSPFGTIALVVAALVISTAIKHVFLITNDYLVGRVSLSVSCDLRNKIFAKAVSMDRLSFEKTGQARFVTSIIQMTEMLSIGLMNALGAAVREPLKIISCTVLACCICWRLMAISCLIAPIVGLLLYLLTKSIKTVANRVLAQATGFHDVLLESLSNVQTIQSFRKEPAEQLRFEEATGMMRKFGLKFIVLSSLAKPIIEFLGVGMLGTTIVAGAYLVLNNQTSIWGITISESQLSVPQLFVFFGALIGISDPLRKLSAVYSSVYTGSIAADSLFPLLDQANEIRDPESPAHVDRPHRKLTIDNLCFHYTPEQQVLQHVRMEIPFGGTIGIIGANGSGKSTLINLLCRFYDPTDGALQLDGQDYRNLNIEDVRSRISLVNQSTELFKESVRYNIKYGRPDATDEEMIAVAKAAHADEFISTVLEDGYDTNVGQNGTRLSGGQRQRIALARALLCNPEILILDEATSQIDMRSEDLICQSLAEHRGERTMIIITHREKLLELADSVYQLDKGVLSNVDKQYRKAA